MVECCAGQAPSACYLEPTPADISIRRLEDGRARRRTLRPPAGLHRRQDDHEKILRRARRPASSDE
eukprot:9178911-Alexandrium_andersonii.AAC.1